MALIKTVLIHMTAIALGALLGFGVAEISLRLIRPQQTGPAMFTYDPRTGSLPKPNLRGRFSVPGLWTYSATHDALGMRVTGIVSRESARTRILLLGDSFAYGVGVNDHETFAYLLEQRLSGTPLRTAVLNAGSGGKGTDYALRFFETIGRDLRPDLTILCFFSNDYVDNQWGTIYDVGSDGTLHPRAERGTTFKRKEFISRSRLYNWLVSWSHLANLVKGMIIQSLTAQEVRAQHGTVGAVISYPDRNDGWSNEDNQVPTKLFLERLAAVVREAGSDFLVVYAPRSGEVDLFRRTGQISKDEAVFISLLGPNSGRSLSLTPLLAKSGVAVAALYYDEARNERPDDAGHWRPAGHALAAGFLEGSVREYLSRRAAARSTGQ